MKLLKVKKKFRLLFNICVYCVERRNCIMLNICGNCSIIMNIYMWLDSKAEKKMDRQTES